VDNTKHWWESKTIIGALVAIFSSILGFIGFSVEPEMQTEFADLVVTLISVIGGLIAIWGRVKAGKSIKSGKNY